MQTWPRPEDAFARHLREISDTATQALREARQLRGDTTTVINQVEVLENTIIQNPPVDLNAYFVQLEVTLASVGAGSTISGSTPWTGRSLCNMIRFQLTVDTELEVMLLRKPVFDSNRTKHKVFHSIGVGSFFMREGGALFDYSDETGGTDLHYWISNVGLSATVPTLLLNKRVPQ